MIDSFFFSGDQLSHDVIRHDAAVVVVVRGRGAGFKNPMLNQI